MSISNIRSLFIVLIAAGAFGTLALYYFAWRVLEDIGDGVGFFDVERIVTFSTSVAIVGSATLIVMALALIGSLLEKGVVVKETTTP